MKRKIEVLQSIALSTISMAILFALYMLFKLVSILVEHSTSNDGLRRGKLNILKLLNEIIHSRLHKHTWLHMGTLIFALMTLVFRLICTLYTWDAESFDYVDEYNWRIQVIFSLLYVIGQHIAMCFYALAILDRFERVAMVIPNTRAYYLCRTLQWIAISLSIMIIVGEVYSKIIWIVGYWKLAENVIFNQLLQLIQIMNGLFCMCLEVTLTMKLVMSSQRSMRKSDKNSRLLVIKMWAFYSALLLFDALTLVFFVAGNLKWMEDSNALIMISTSFLMGHVYFGFKLLDIFLQNLQQKASCSTTKQRTSRSDIVTTGLIDFMQTTTTSTNEVSKNSIH